MSSPSAKGESYRDTWRRERDELAEAIQEAERDEEFQEAALSVEEELERSRNTDRRDPQSYCPVHHRYLSYPEWTGNGCLWCLHGSKEAYNRYLESRNLDGRGRPKKPRAVRTIA